MRQHNIANEQSANWPNFPIGECREAIINLQELVTVLNNDVVNIQKELIATQKLMIRSETLNQTEIIRKRMFYRDTTLVGPSNQVNNESIENDINDYTSLLSETSGLSASDLSTVEKHIKLLGQLDRVVIHLRTREQNIRKIAEAHVDEDSKYLDVSSDPDLNCSKLDPKNESQKICGYEICRTGIINSRGECEWKNINDGNSCPMKVNGKKSSGFCSLGQCTSCSHTNPQLLPLYVYSRPVSENPCVDFLPCNCTSVKKKGFRLPDGTPCGKTSDKLVCYRAQCVTQKLMKEDLLIRLKDVTTPYAQCSNNQNFKDRWELNLPEFPDPESKDFAKQMYCEP